MILRLQIFDVKLNIKDKSLTKKELIKKSIDCDGILSSITDIFDSDTILKLPSKIMRFADKMIDSIKRVNLTRRKQLFLLNYVINGLGLDLQKLRMFTQKIKRGMNSQEDEGKY